MQLPVFNRSRRSAKTALGRLNPAEPVRLSAVIDFEQLPHALLATESVSPVAYEAEPTDKGLWKLLSPFVEKDILKPALTGINFDSFGVAATDGHRLVMIPARSSKIRGLFTGQGAKEIDYRFPDYQYAIPRPDAFLFSGPVNLRALRSYVQAMLPFVNQTTYRIPFIITGKTYIGFNGRLLLETILFFEHLGVDTAYAHFVAHNKAVIFSVEKNYDFQTAQQPAVLQMPVVLANYSGNNTPEFADFPYDIDFKRGVQAIWHFDKNTVLAAPTGKAYSFSTKTGQWNYPPTPSDQLPGYVFKVLAKMLPTKANVPIIELVRKVGDRLVATGDLTSFYTHQLDTLAQWPDGMYRLVGKKALVPEEDNPIDYPRLPAAVSVADRAVSTSAPWVELPAGVLAEAAEFAGTDELKRAMLCVNLQLQAGSEQATIVSSNGHVLYRKRMPLRMQPVVRNIDRLIPAKMVRLHELIAPVGAGRLTYAAGMGELRYPADSIAFRDVEENYPNVKPALVSQFVRHLQVPVAPFLKALGGFKAPKDGSYYLVLANDGERWSVLQIDSAPSRGKTSTVLESIPLGVETPETLRAYEADVDGLLVMPLHPDAFPDYPLVFNCELFRKALANYRPASELVMNIGAAGRGIILSPTTSAATTSAATTSAATTTAARVPAQRPTKQALLVLKAKAIIIIQQQEAEAGLRGAPKPYSQPAPRIHMVYDLGGLGRLTSEELSARRQKKADQAAEAETSFLPELSVRVKKSTAKRLPADFTITRSADMAALFVRLYGRDTLGHKERIYVIYTDRKNAPIGYMMDSIGTKSGATVDIPNILGVGLKIGASAILICHNHPSGSITPSDADKQLTQRLAQAAKQVDLQLLDHIIVTAEGKYFSFLDDGQLDSFRARSSAPSTSAK